MDLFASWLQTVEGTKKPPQTALNHKCVAKYALL